MISASVQHISTSVLPSSVPGRLASRWRNPHRVRSTDPGRSVVGTALSTRVTKPGPSGGRPTSPRPPWAHLLSPSQNTNTASLPQDTFAQHLPPPGTHFREQRTLGVSSGARRQWCSLLPPCSMGTVTSGTAGQGLGDVSLLLGPRDSPIHTATVASAGS